MLSKIITNSNISTVRVASIVFAMTGATSTDGGIASANLNILHALLRLTRDRNLEFRILCLNESDVDRPKFIPAEISYRAFDGDKLRYSLALIRSFKRDNLYVFDHVRLALPLSPFLVAGGGGCVISAHGSESWARIRPGSKWLFKRASLCLANSYFTLRKMRESFNGFNGVDCLLGLSPAHKLNEQIPTMPEKPLKLRSVDGVERVIGPRMILLVGRMDSTEGEKGHAQLLNVWGTILEQFPNAQLVFAGSGDAREKFLAKAREFGVDSAVFIPGYQSIEDLQELYRACYAFVMPSGQEGFGLVYLEAMNYAKPCVGCVENGSEDVIVNGETGFLIKNPVTHVELLYVLERLLSSESKTFQMGIQGWIRLHEHFTSRHAQQRIIDRLIPLL